MVNKTTQFEMRATLSTLTLILICVHACARHQAQNAPKISTEQQIWAALCDLEKGDPINAQKKIEAVLKSDPENFYARKVFLCILERRIKPGDNSPENIVQIRKGIEGHSQAMKNPQFTSEEKVKIDTYLVTLYRQLGGEELNNELQRRASDSNRTPKERANGYAILASMSWACSFEITSLKRGLGKSEIEKAEECIARGRDFVNQAITLDGENEQAWSYKADILREAVALAGLKGDQTQRVAYKNQYDEVLRHGKEVRAKHVAVRQEQSATEQEDLKGKWPTNQPDDSDQISKELTEYRAETSLADAVKVTFLGWDVELSSLVAPIPIPEEKSTAEMKPQAVPPGDKNPEPSPQAGCFREIDGPAQVEEKREWKTFSPDQDIVVDLPDNVCRSDHGYIAASDGVMYIIVPMARPPIPLPPIVVEGVLNNLARTFAGFRSRSWLGSPGTNFEIKLLRKEDVNGQPRKVYSYVLASCSVRKENVLITQASKTHYYTIDINGANESDERVQRFLKSLKFK